MAPATRKTATSKAAKPSVPAGKLPSGAVRDANALRDKELAATVLERRKAGEKYGPIASDLGITVGKAIYLYECASVAPKDKIRWTTAEDLAAKIVAARQNGLSWGRISAYSSVPEGRVRSIWEKTTGKSAMGESIGKGGRKANGIVVAKKPAAAKPKAAAAPKAVKPAAKKPAVAKVAAATTNVEAEATATTTPVAKRTIKRRKPAAA